MSRILVTGAKGMLGTDLCELLHKENHEVSITDISELDVRDTNQVLRHVDECKPEIIFHLAALTDVDGCEKDPDAAFLTNTIGTQNIALACQAKDIPLVYVSTISVFNGNKCEPYTEFDHPDPVSFYSRSKYEGERVVENLLTKYYIVRAGWMFGGGLEDKKFVAKIIELAMERDQLNIVDDKFGSPTYTRDISRGMIELVKTGLYGTYHMVNTGGFCSRYEFAQAILSSAGIIDCELHPVSSAAFPLPAHRPRMEAARNLQAELRNWHWMPKWQETLKDYIRTVLLPDIRTSIR